MKINNIFTSTIDKSKPFSYEEMIKNPGIYCPKSSPDYRIVIMSNDNSKYTCRIFTCPCLNGLWQNLPSKEEWGSLSFNKVNENIDIQIRL